MTKKKPQPFGGGIIGGTGCSMPMPPPPIEYMGQKKQCPPRECLWKATDFGMECVNCHGKIFDRRSTLIDL